MTKQYLDHSKEILTSERSNFKGGSKGSGIISLFGYQSVHDLREGYPLLTTKEMATDAMFDETLWFLKGRTDLKYLEDRDCKVWRADTFQHNLPKMVEDGVFPAGMEKYSSEWNSAKKEYGNMIKEDKDGFAEKYGDAGPIYGHQWTKWEYFDKEDQEFKTVNQLEQMVEGLKKKPTGKKHIVNSWNAADLPRMSLEPCHVLFQATANEQGELELQLYQRSCDQFLGVPFNKAGYAAVTDLIGRETGLTPKTFIHTFGDAHFYTGVGDRTKWHKENFGELQKKVRNAISLEEKKGDKTGYLEVKDWIDKNAPSDGNIEKYDHVTAILEQLSRNPRPLPKLEISDTPINELEKEDFKVKDYNPHPRISRRMCV